MGQWLLSALKKEQNTPSISECILFRHILGYTNVGSHHGRVLQYTAQLTTCQDVMDKCNNMMTKDS